MKTGKVLLIFLIKITLFQLCFNFFKCGKNLMVTASRCHLELCHLKQFVDHLYTKPRQTCSKGAEVEKTASPHDNKL